MLTVRRRSAYLWRNSGLFCQPVDYWRLGIFWPDLPLVLLVITGLVWMPLVLL